MHYRNTHHTSAWYMPLTPEGTLDFLEIKKPCLVMQQSYPLLPQFILSSDDGGNIRRDFPPRVLGLLNVCAQSPILFVRKTRESIIYYQRVTEHIKKNETWFFM